MATLRLGDPPLGKVVLQAADAVEVGVEPAPGDGLDLVQHELAVAEGVEPDRQPRRAGCRDRRGTG